MKHQEYKKSGNRGFFDEQDTYQEMLNIVNPLEMVSNVIDFEIFSDKLESKLLNQVHEKGYLNKPLTEEQKASNHEKSKTRARVEHVFGFMEQSMNGLFWSPQESPEAGIKWK